MPVQTERLRNKSTLKQKNTGDRKAVHNENFTNVDYHLQKLLQPKLFLVFFLPCKSTEQRNTEENLT